MSLEATGKFAAFVSSLSGMAAFWLLFTLLILLSGGAALIAYFTYRRLEDRMDARDKAFVQKIESRDTAFGQKIDSSMQAFTIQIGGIDEKIERVIRSGSEHHKILHDKSDKNTASIARIEGALNAKKMGE